MRTTPKNEPNVYFKNLYITLTFNGDIQLFKNGQWIDNGSTLEVTVPAGHNWGESLPLRPKWPWDRFIKVSVGPIFKKDKDDKVVGKKEWPNCENTCDTLYYFGMFHGILFVFGAVLVQFLTPNRIKILVNNLWKICRRFLKKEGKNLANHLFFLIINFFLVIFILYGIYLIFGYLGLIKIFQMFYQNYLFGKGLLVDLFLLGGGYLTGLLVIKNFKHPSQSKEPPSKLEDISDKELEAPLSK